MVKHSGPGVNRTWVQIPVPPPIYQLCVLGCVTTSLSLTFLTCGMGVLKSVEILYIKCLASDLAYSKCSVVELSNWEELGRLLGGGGDTS